MSGNQIAGVVLVLLGLFYALAPHSLHVSSGLGLGLDHGVHQLLGVVFLAAGAYIGWVMKPTKAAARPRKRRRR